MLSNTNSSSNMVTDENVAPNNTSIQQLKASLASSAGNKLTIKQLESQEPILQDNPSRFVLFPVKYKDVLDNHNHFGDMY